MRVTLLITLLWLSATFVICQADDTPYKSRRGPSSFSRRREPDSGGEAADLQGNQDQGTPLSSRRGQLRSSAVPRPTKQTESDTESGTSDRGRRRFGSAAATQQRGSDAEDSKIEVSTRRHQEQPVPSERTVVRTVRRRPVTATREHQAKPEEPAAIEDDDNYPEHFKQQLKSGKSLPATSSKEPRPQSVKLAEKETNRPRTSSGSARRLPRPHTTSDSDPVEPQTPEAKKNVLTKPRVSPGFARGRLPSRPSSTSSEDENRNPKLSILSRGRLPSRPSSTAAPELSEEPPNVEDEKPKPKLSTLVRGRLPSRPSSTANPESEPSEEPPEDEKPKPKLSPGFTRGRLPSRQSSTAAPESEPSEEQPNVEDEKPKLSTLARGRLPTRPTSASRSQATKPSLTRGSHTTAAPESDIVEDKPKPRTSSGFARGRSLSHRAQTTSAPESPSSKLSPSSLRSRASLFRETAKLRTTSKPKVENAPEDTNVEDPAEPDDDIKQKSEEQTTESSTKGTAPRGRQSSRSRGNKSLDDTSINETKDSSSTPAPEVSSSTPEEQEESVSEESVHSTPRSREYVRRKNIINYSSAEQTTEATTSTSTARTREYVRRKNNINYSSTEKTVQSSTESTVNVPRTTRQYVRRKNKINYPSEEQTTAAEPAKNHRSRGFTRERHLTRSKKEQVSEVSSTTETNPRFRAETTVENIPKSEELEPTEIAIGETTVPNTPRSRYSAKHRRLEIPREGKSVNVTAIKSKHRYSSKFRSNLFLAKATSTPSPNDVAQTTEMSEQEAIRRLREKFPLLSSRVPNKRPRWFTSTTPISDLVAASASESPSLLTSTDPIEHYDYTEANFAQETMAEGIVDASFTTMPPVETSTPENKKPTMISFVLHTPDTPIVETVEEQKYPESEAGTINSFVIDNSLITTTESTNEVNFDKEIQTELPRFSQELEQTSKYITESNSNQVTEATTASEPIVSSTSRFIVKNGILLLNTEPTPMKTDKKSAIGDQGLEDLLLNQIVSAVAVATNEVTTSNPSVTQHFTLSNNSNSEFSSGNSYKPIAYSSPSTESTTHVTTNYTPLSMSSTSQVPITTSTTTQVPVTSQSTTSTTTQVPVTSQSTTSTTTQVPVTSQSTTSTTTQAHIVYTSTTTSTTTQAPIVYTSTTTSTTTQAPKAHTSTTQVPYSSTTKIIPTQEPRSYFAATTQHIPLMYQPRFAMRIPIAPPGTMSSTPSSAIRYHFILKTTPETSTNFNYNSINPVTTNKNTTFDKASEIKNTTLSTPKTSSTSTTISPPNTTIFQTNKIEGSRSLNSTMASAVDTRSTTVSLPNVTPSTTNLPTTTKHVTTSVITNPTTERVITTQRITTPIAITTLLISTASTPVTSPQITAIPINHIPVTTPHANTPAVTTSRVPATTPRVTATLTTPIPVTTPRVYTPASTTVRLSTPIPITTPRVTAIPTTAIPLTTPRVNTPTSTTIRYSTPTPVTTPRVTAISTTSTPVTTPRRVTTTHTPVTTPRKTTSNPITTPRVTAIPTTRPPVATLRASIPASTTIRVTTPIPVTTPRSPANSVTPTTPVPPTKTTTTRAAPTPLLRETTSTTSATTSMRTTSRVTTPESITHDSINDITSLKENNVKPTDWTYKNILNLENSASSPILPLTNEKSGTSKNKVESPKEDAVGLTPQDLLILELLSRQRLGNNRPTTEQPHDGLLLSKVLESQRSGTQKSVAQQAAPSFSLPVDPEPPRAQTADATWFAILRQLGSASFGLPAPQLLPVRTEGTPRVTTTTTTTLPPRSNQQESQRTPKRQRINKPETTTVAPETVNLPPAPQAEAGDTQSALVTVAINVTRTMAGLMGRVIQGAARTVSAVVSDSGRVFANYLQTWQIPAAQ